MEVSLSPLSFDLPQMMEIEDMLHRVMDKRWLVVQLENNNPNGKNNC